ncbi:hypothetical protein QTG54_010128 [Skeletonema marinoi]|uniref:Uncharacterized protein n=1 Tax=Skeletonema marinoi TaxID=267567 RepID=A0AAD8Y3J7_9STRA|nr:hypothetical protein QTG54_010128 [Skeletonema marinoi]
MPSQSNDAHSNTASPRRGYRVTGRAAHLRVARLFEALCDDHTTHDEQTRWIDTSPYANTAATPINNTNDTTDNNEPEISFLWENAPRYETKSIRDAVQVYSHLPNGINVLDDKWALARLMPSNCNDNDEALVTLESHCFRGSEGFVTFAKQYAWPPTLYKQRKCHVRVYGLLTSDGRAYVHKRAFLHVANEIFEYDSSSLLRVMVSRLKNTIEPIRGACCVGRKSAAYVQGGQANNGFEYLGLDFVLSSVPEEGDGHSTRRKPVAYLLEVNAPPSQDTATGLPHAEELHDEVISDLLRLWVLPNLGIKSVSKNGWECVYSPPISLDNGSSVDVEEPSNLIVPSKAAILNKIRWAMFERRTSKMYESSWRKEEAGVACSESDHPKSHKCESINGWNIFLESGGGAQVPRVVINAMTTSLMNRDRSIVGAKYLSEARKSIASLLAGSRSEKKARRKRRSDSYNGSECNVPH